MNKQYKQNKECERITKKIGYLMVSMILFIILIGCTKVVKPNLNISGTSKIPEVVEKQDVRALGVVKDINVDEGTITYLDINYETDFTLKYNGGADILDKYNGVISILQIKIGEIVDLYYSSETNNLTKLQISSEAWEYQGVANLVIAKTNKIMSISKKKYKYTNELVIFSEDNLIELIDINKKDELTVKGRGGVIYSIIVDKGHGYIRLTNYEDFIDGIIEIGYDIIVPIVKDMLIIAREGNYKMVLEKDSLVGKKNINVIRDKEIVVDMSEFALEPLQRSNVDFTIIPDGADLYIDNKLTDYDEVVELKFGKYKIEVKLGGYITYLGTLTADKVSLDIKIDLVEKTVNKDTIESDLDNENTDKSSEESYDNNNSDPDSKNESDDTRDIEATGDNENEVVIDDSASEKDADHEIHVLEPEGVEVYLNGTLKGISPVSFEKEIGTHTLSFRKDGYITKSYTVEVIDDSSDVQFNFPSMKSTN